MIHNILASRRSRRAIGPRVLSASDLEDLMEASRIAPSCMNKQSWMHMFVTQDPSLSKVRQALGPGNYWALEAPLLIVSAFDPDRGCRLDDSRDYAAMELGFSLQNILLQAVSLGLIAHPMAGFEPLKLREAFGIPSSTTIMTVTAIGHQDSTHALNEKHTLGETSPRTLRPIDETISLNTWIGLGHG